MTDVSRNPKIVKIAEEFELSASRMRQFVRDFHNDMALALKGKRSPLQMISTYVARPTGRENGACLALDLGGSNFRILEVELKGRGRIIHPHAMRFNIKSRYANGDGYELFDFLAGCVHTFLRRRGIKSNEKLAMGFTFSFPVDQNGLASGKLLSWTKGFNARDVVGKDVVELLRLALKRKGVFNIEVVALINDTVGTLMAGSYSDPRCDMGVIIGTGTNACYPEKTSRVNVAGHAGKKDEVIINIEWGNFNKTDRTYYDRMLDRSSTNVGRQIFEKMVSGMYLGEITRLVLLDVLGRTISGSAAIKDRYSFRTEYMSVIEGDGSRGQAKTNRILRALGVETTPYERRAARAVCAIVSRRAARLAASAITAVVTRMDSRLERRHTIAIDGSVYEKHPTFAKKMREAFDEIIGKKASRIEMKLVKDGSGKGAAITAAIAYVGKDTAC